MPHLSKTTLRKAEAYLRSAAALYERQNTARCRDRARLLRNLAARLLRALQEARP